MPEKLVEVKDVEISFGEGSKKFVAVHNANFFINKGETFSLVGESGSGKTTIGRAIIGLNDTSNGEIIFDGKKINGHLSHSEKNDLIRRIQMIFQDPAASLMNVQQLIISCLRACITSISIRMRKIVKLKSRKSSKKWDFLRST